MILFNFKIKINNSFNKNKELSKKSENILNDSSTLNNIKNILETNSISIGSITSSHIDNGISIINKKNKKIFWKEIIIGTISTVLGAILSYLIFGIK